MDTASETIGSTTSEDTVGSTTGATETSTVDPPTTGSPTTGTTTTTDSTTDSSTTDSTTGGPGVVTRILYHPLAESNGSLTAASARLIEIVDGVAAPPVTLVDPPGAALNSLDVVLARGWWPYSTPQPDAPQLWLVDRETLTPHEITLPPELERVVTARLTREDKHLVVWGAPIGVSDGAEYTYYQCELGPAAECALEVVESGAGPNTYIAAIHDISTGGKIWYSTYEIGGDAVTVLQADVSAPQDAIILAEFPDFTEAGLAFVSLDEKTAYFSVGDDAEVLAMDIASTPPGPLISLHPPQMGARHRWSDDEKDLLLLVADGLWGDLFHIAVDGATAGPMVAVDTGKSPSVYAKAWQLLPDKRILFLSDHETPMANQVYVTDSADLGSPPVRVSGALQATGEVNDAFLRDAPAHVLYCAQDSAQSPSRLYRASIDPPGEVVAINESIAEETFMQCGAHDVSVDGTRVVYAAEEVVGRTDLFLVDIDGDVATAPINLTSGLPPDTDVSLLGYLAPDAAQVFFIAGGPNATRGPLYMVPLSPEVGPPVQISADGESIYNFFVLDPS